MQCRDQCFYFPEWTAVPDSIDKQTTVEKALNCLAGVLILCPHLGLVPSAAVMALGTEQADALSGLVSWQARASSATLRFIFFIFIKTNRSAHHCSPVPLQQLWLVLSEALALPGEGDGLPVPGNALHPPTEGAVTEIMQPHNTVEECSATDLLSGPMWKIIFMLQANSCSDFWNDWIPGDEKSSLCFWIRIWFLPWSKIPRLWER